MEVYLLHTWISRRRDIDGVNINPSGVRCFVRRFKLVDESRFPPVTREGFTHRPNAAVVYRPWTKELGVFSGVMMDGGYYGAIVDRRSRAVLRGAIRVARGENPISIHNLLIYKNLAVMTTDECSIMVLPIDSGHRHEACIVKGLNVADYVGGFRQLNSNRAVCLDDDFLYVQATTGLCRIDLSSLKEDDLATTVADLFPQTIYSAPEITVNDFYVGESRIFVATTTRLLAICKKTLKTMVSLDILFEVIAGTDSILFGSHGSTIELFKPSIHMIKKKYSITRADMSPKKRNLKVCRFKSVNFLVSVNDRAEDYEKPPACTLGLMVFAAVRYRLQFVTFYRIDKPELRRILGFGCDEGTKTLFVMLDYDRSFTLKMTYG